MGCFLSSTIVPYLILVVSTVILVANQKSLCGSIYHLRAGQSQIRSGLGTSLAFRSTQQCPVCFLILVGLFSILNLKGWSHSPVN